MKKMYMIMTILLAVLVVGCSTTSQDNKLETESFETNEEVPTSFQDNVEDIDNNMNDSMEKEMGMEKDMMNDSMKTEMDMKDSMKTVNSYREFDLEEFTNELSSGKYVVLDFYSDWCPSCNSEDDILKENFNTLENIVIFKVNHGDSQTSEDEEMIAEQFEVTSRDTGIVLKDSVEISRYSGHKNKLEYEELFNSLS